MALGPADSGGITFDVANTFAVWIEVFLYGVYVTLFVSAITVILKKRATARMESAHSAWIFLICVILMFMVATLHLVINVYRFLRANILGVDPAGALHYFFDSTRWENITANAIMCVMSWLGDALVIYRCYYVWDCNFWIVALPLVLFFGTIGINSSTLYWFTHPYDTHLKVPTMISLLNAIFPLALTQNVLTTGLIAFKIWLQHKASSRSGVVDRGSRLSLIRILIIIIESAMVYTLQLLVVIILYFKKSNAQFIVQSAIVPSVGIVFVLIAVRVHVAKSQSVFGTGLGTLPAWLDEDTSDSEMNGDRSSSPVAGVTFRVSTNDQDRYHPSEPLDSSSYTQKSHTGDKLLHMG
ncbi:hypothetical protein JR316_0011592 [Psilocybe cubensis]|uniref:Uncharacterized protein n=2 Tax=Psilocybe cubensis TaxID=181762 RepID=A0ACB8GKG4_PSICU|nr:hypothetical protein JR316_0011592 [Psilocybe cubensis]KAH9476023.1 hypothetical protein JR316_0011592 [Psilocybe cubensis]